MTRGDEPVNLAEGDWPDDEALDQHSPAAPAPTAARPVDPAPVPVSVPVLTARPGVSPTVRWVAFAAATAGVTLLARCFRNCLLRRRS